MKALLKSSKAYLDWVKNNPSLVWRTWIAKKWCNFPRSLNENPLPNCEITLVTWRKFEPVTILSST